jgi:membrane protease subunit (stomatin/prohibitin family)
MGLLKAGIGALSSALSDTWRDYFYCEALSADVLVEKGHKKDARKDDNIITNGSIIAVNDGQCMIITEQGLIVDVCAEPGEFVYDTSTEPSIFDGSLGEGIKKTFSVIGKRFQFGGTAPKDQRVYFFNTKEIVGNKYGTPTPVPFRVVDKNVGLDVDISIRCNGEYSYKIVDPLLFYKNVCGNVEGEYTRDQIDSQLKTELMTALQPALAKISEAGIRYSALPGHTTEISDALNDVLSQKWKGTRGIQVASFGINSVSASEEDEQMIKELQRNAAYKDPTMAAATLVGAQAQAMESAAKNTAGAFVGFAGMNMANQAGGVNAGNLYNMGQQQANQAVPQQQDQGWTCSCGATGNTGKFCTNCGKPKPADNAGEWICSCGAHNTGKFCTNCGKPRQ